MFFISPIFDKTTFFASCGVDYCLGKETQVTPISNVGRRTLRRCCQFPCVFLAKIKAKTSEQYIYKKFTSTWKPLKIAYYRGGVVWNWSQPVFTTLSPMKQAVIDAAARVFWPQGGFKSRRFTTQCGQKKSYSKCCTVIYSCTSQSETTKFLTSKMIFFSLFSIIKLPIKKLFKTFFFENNVLNNPM